MWAIRDARGLNSKEKVFLLITESRGELFGKWDRNAADMGLSKNHYYEARASLLAKGLLLAVRRYENTTVYVVNHEAFPYQECDSYSGNNNSRIRNGRSRIGETKKNTKKNTKVELEEEQPTVPDGPVVNPLPNYTVREEPQDVETPPTTKLQGRGAAAPSVYSTEEELRERRARALGRA